LAASADFSPVSRPPAVAANAFAAIALAALAGCVGKGVALDAPRVARGLAIGPFAVHQECLAAADGDRIDFTFDSSDPVRFGLAYREGAAMVFPVEHDATRAQAGVFEVRLAREYCLIWEAGVAGAVVDYRVRLRPGGQ
jgi:hypothetical protein